MTPSDSVTVSLGRTVATPAALAAVSPPDLAAALRRHAAGDRGDVTPADFARCREYRLELIDIEPIYAERHPGPPPTVKQHLAAVRMLSDWLVTGQVFAMNPAASVRGPRHVV